MYACRSFVYDGVTMMSDYVSFMIDCTAYTCTCNCKNRIKLRSFKRSEHINEKGDGPYRGFGY